MDCKRLVNVLLTLAPTIPVEANKFAALFSNALNALEPEEPVEESLEVLVEDD